MHELMAALRAERDAMADSVRDVRRTGLAKADAERAYQVAKARRALQLKAEGHSAAMIQMILKGDDEVSLPLFNRDCAEAEYEAAKQAHNHHKLNARFIEAQIEREWAQERRM